MNEKMLGSLVAAIERIANAQEEQVRLLQELHDIKAHRKQLDDDELELKGLIRSYRMMIRELQVTKENDKEG